MSLTFRRHINSYTDLQQEELTRIERDGERDGEANLPESTVDDYVGLMLTKLTTARGDWNRYCSGFAAKEDELRASIDEIDQGLRADIPSEIASLQAKRQEDADLFDRKEGARSASYEKIESALQSSKRDFDRLRAELGRPVVTHFEKIYIPFLAFLAVAEVPINRNAFELQFQDSNVVVLLLALAVGSILVFFAHSIGKLFKETNSGSSHSNMKKYLGIGFLSITSLVLMYFLAGMRQAVANLEDGGGGVGTFDSITSGTGIDMLSESVLTPLGSSGISLLVLNIVVFVAGALASFYRHDSHPYYEQVTKRFEKAKDQIYKKKNTIEERLHRIQSDFNEKMSAVRARETNLNKDLSQAKNELGELRQAKKDDFSSLINAVDRILLSYQSGNKKMRTEPAPRFFAKSHKSKIKHFIEGTE